MKKILSILLPGTIAALVCRGFYTHGFNKGVKETNDRWQFAFDVDETVRKKYEGKEKS